MRPFYFGESKRPLFGAYEAATGDATRGAVLLCYPFGAEYLRSHRAFRELAHRLSEAGIHAMRFDYYGSGDSAGGNDEGSIELWLEDVRLAFDELRETSGVARPSILGVRLGATLAALATSRGVSADQLFLWDPVLNGNAYIDELADRHKALVAARPRPAGYVPDDPPTEALGMPLTETLRAGLAAIDLTRIDHCWVRRALIFGSDRPDDMIPLLGRFASLGIPAERSTVKAVPVWLKQDDRVRTLVPREVLDLVTNTLVGQR